jgi:hypothetical protein
MQAKDPFDFRTYIVCPNTVITIGTEDSSGVFTGGDSTLDLRQFSRVHCGEDGSSANNCTVRGGQHQIRVSSYSYNKEDKQRIEVKGFTFEGATQYNVFAAFADGDFLIEDCIFRHNVKGAIVFAALAVQMPPLITFRRCIFDQNQMGDIPSLFTVEGIALAITDSVFSNNIFYSDTVVRSFYFFVLVCVLLYLCNSKQQWSFIVPLIAHNTFFKVGSRLTLVSPFFPLLLSLPDCTPARTHKMRFRYVPYHSAPPFCSRPPTPRPRLRCATIASLATILKRWV